MDDWRSTRQANAKAIWKTASRLPGLRVPQVPQDVEHAAYKCYVFVESGKLAEGWHRDRIINAIVEAGVPCFSGSCSEVYLEKAFDNTGWRPEVPLSVARELGETSLMFLVHPTLTADEVEKTCRVLTSVMEQAVNDHV
jgi:dTDP-4-amino-4,6-dideoxygalactose transaminase